MPGCNCTLPIVGLVLSSLTSFLQVACIYLDKYEGEINTGWFPYITMFANAALAGINAFQIGLRRTHEKTTPRASENRLEKSQVEITVLEEPKEDGEPDPDLLAR